MRLYVAIGVGTLAALPLAAAAVYYVAAPTELQRFDSVRDQLLSELRSKIKLGSNEQLSWSPMFGVSTYPLGSVFLPNENFLRYTVSCDGAPMERTATSTTFGYSRTFEIALDTEVAASIDHLIRPAEIKSEFHAATHATYTLTLGSAEAILSKLSLVQHMVQRPQCLADIANRPVVILSSRIIGREKYVGAQSLYSRISVFFSSLVDASSATRHSDAYIAQDHTDRVVVWTLSEMTLTDKRFPSELNSSARLVVASDILGSESDYTSTVEARLTFSPFYGHQQIRNSQ